MVAAIRAGRERGVAGLSKPGFPGPRRQLGRRRAAHSSGRPSRAALAEPCSPARTTAIRSWRARRRRLGCQHPAAPGTARRNFRPRRGHRLGAPPERGAGRSRPAAGREIGRARDGGGGGRGGISLHCSRPLSKIYGFCSLAVVSVRSVLFWQLSIAESRPIVCCGKLCVNRIALLSCRVMAEVKDCIKSQERPVAWTAVCTPPVQQADIAETGTA